MAQQKNEIEKYIEQYGERVSRLCINLCGNHADADDLYQDTWMKVIKNIDKYDRSRNFEKWLFKICVNTYKNERMKAFRRKSISFKTTEDQDIFFEMIPDRDEAYMEKYREVVEIIRELPEKYRTALALRYFSDFSENDAAEILGVPAGTLKSRLNRARKLIKGRLNDE